MPVCLPRSIRHEWVAPQERSSHHYSPDDIEAVTQAGVFTDDCEDAGRAIQGGLRVVARLLCSSAIRFDEESSVDKREDKAQYEAEKMENWQHVHFIIELEVECVQLLLPIE